MPPEVKVRRAVRASFAVATFAIGRPSTAFRTASAQLAAGTRKIVAPAAFAPTSFCGMPPIGPTLPSSSSDQPSAQPSTGPTASPLNGGTS